MAHTKKKIKYEHNEGVNSSLSKIAYQLSWTEQTKAGG